MIPYDRSFKDIIQDFRSMGIDTSMPGFYDDPAFLEAERQTPTALRNYARFVCDRAYDENYLRMAAEKVRIVADALHKELEKDGRKGACIDVSQVASRMLENEGVWNCLLTGALTIYYPPEVSRQPRFFWPLDVTEAVAAHAWLCAPPFRVVDITIREQPHELGLRDPLPRLVLAENLKPASVQDRDIVSPKAKAVGQRRGYTTAELIRQEKPDIKDFFRVFPPGIAEHEGVRIKYIPWQVSAAEAPLENITALSLNGKYGQEIYETIVTPRLSGMLP